MVYTAAALVAENNNLKEGAVLGCCSSHRARRPHFYTFFGSWSFPQVTLRLFTCCFSAQFKLYYELWSLILLFLISPDAFLLPAAFLIKSPNDPPAIYKKRNKWNVLAYLWSFTLCWSIAIPWRVVCESNYTLLKTSVFRQLLTLCWTYNCSVRVWVEATQKIWPLTLF